MTDSFADETLLVRSSAALWRRLLDGVLILTPEMSEPLRITAPGDVVWLWLEEPQNIDDIADGLATLYGVTSDTVRADIAPVLRELFELGAIVSVTDQDSEPRT